jgi:hypothetical protein
MLQSERLADFEARTLTRHRMWKRLKTWYEGEYIPPENDPHSRLVFIVGHYKRPFLARVLSICFEFFSKHWQWCIGTALVIIALTINFTRTH